MTRKIIWLLISCLMALSLVLASCGGAEEEEEEVTVPTEEEEVVIPTEEEEVVVPPGGNWWDYHGEPQYGGTLVWRLKQDVSSFDPWRSRDMSGVTALYTEPLTMMGWTQDRETCPYSGGFTPFVCQVPLLAESWETNNYETYTFHIRKGVYWQDKPPVNGREFTAYDIEYSFHRLYGKGEFTGKSTPYTYFKGWDTVEDCYATDKYTFVVKCLYSVPGKEGILLSTLAGGSLEALQCREVVEQYGDLTDWRNAVGTGPFILDDYVTGTSATYSKNPNYWGWDQRYPKNEIPYVDGVKLLIIPDDSTAYAALRTGKICMMPDVNWEQADAFAKSSPEIIQVEFPLNGWGVTMRYDREPFTDIKVRQALNMAINRKEIAATYYGGRVGGEEAYSNYGPSAGPYYTPFEEWPEDLQYHHTYNPEGAKALLAEAGYPNGFKTNMIVSSAHDLALPQIIKEYFADIGVDMEIKVVEATVFFSYVNIGKKHDQMVWGMQGANAAGGWLPQFSGKNIKGWGVNVCMIDDPVLTELIDREALYPFDSEGKISYNKQSDMYAMNLYLTVNTIPLIGYTLYQPWLKGYSGERVTTPDSTLFARWFIDHDLKKAMGH